MSKTITKVGCCGFPIARPKYFKTFPVVEIQQTFYEPPKPDTAGRWRQEAPADFEFTLKAWQLITHEASSPTYRRLKTALRDDEKKQVGGFRWTDPVRRAWEKTLQIARLLHADKVIFQCPASFAPTSRNKEQISKFFGKIDRCGVTCVWEPRGKWQEQEVSDLCRQLNLVHCVDPFKNECVTYGLCYYRLHGITGYRHKYTEAELGELTLRHPKETQTYFLFNNISMQRDAERFMKLLDRLV